MEQCSVTYLGIIRLRQMGRINGFKGRGRPRKAYKEEMIKQPDCSRFLDTKSLASNREEWWTRFATTRQGLLWIRRILWFLFLIKKRVCSQFSQIWRASDAKRKLPIGHTSFAHVTIFLVLFFIMRTINILHTLQYCHGSLVILITCFNDLQGISTSFLLGRRVYDFLSEDLS